MMITNIRKSRKNPGLQPQHRTAVMAAASIANARVQGAELSSTALEFRPNRTSGGTYYFDVAERKAAQEAPASCSRPFSCPSASRNRGHW